jgi:TusE/DsrC/DsvC family sulfur relay protein
MSDPGQVTFDEHGFLCDPHQWNVAIARAMAKSVGLGDLDPAHFAVLEVLRDHYLSHRTVLPAQEVCREVGMERHCIRHLFDNYGKAWKTAGLPDPGMDLRAEMEDAG